MNDLIETFFQLTCGFANLIASAAPKLSAGIADVAGEDFGFFMFMIAIAMGVCVIAIVAAIAVTAVLLLLIGAFGLGSLGLSIFAGLRARSLRQGFRTFCISFCILCGTLIAVLLTYLGGFILNHDVGLGVTAAVTVGGAVAGWCVGWGIFKVLHFALNAVGRRIQLRASQS